MASTIRQSVILAETAPATPAREVLLRATATEIQWRYTNTSWVTLLPLSALVGPAGASVTGPAGADGVGTVGPVGATGAQGGSGIAGPMGATGPAGPPGIGVKGDTGSAGAVGSVGPAGSAGAQGPIGVTGSVGPVGPSGTTFLAVGTLTQTAVVAIAVGVREVAMPVTGTVAGGAYFVSVTSHRLNGGASQPGRPAGYYLADWTCRANGVVQVVLSAPLLAIGQSYEMTCAVYRVG